MSQSAQSFENHAKYVPAYHFFASPLLFLSTLFFAYRAATAPSLDSVVALLFAVGVVVVSFFARLFALGVQDRVIRLEERLRMERVLPEPQRGRVLELTTSQLIGLRYASDEELPGLVERALSGELANGKSVKAAVTQWRADHQRI